MPKSSKFDIVAENEEQSVKKTLATLRSRNELSDLLCQDMLISKPLDKWYFYSITIPPTAIINCRGKTKAFADASVAQQHYFFNNRILHYKYEYLKDAYIIIEHNKNGIIHFHVLINISTEFVHNVEMELADIFLIKKTHRTINLKGEEVHDFFKIIAYFFKAPTQIVGCETNIELNESITRKQYEISKFFTYHITSVCDNTIDYGEYFNL